MMCRREGGRVGGCYACAWMGWFLGGCGREGNGLGSASRRGGELRDVDTTERIEGRGRCSRGREITAPPILQQARRLPISLRGALL